MSKLKIAGISLISLFLIFSIVVVSWFTYIKFEGSEHIVSDTYYVGLQTLPDNSNTKYFVEVNYLSNETGNGVSLFEVKFNEAREKSVVERLKGNTPRVATTKVSAITKEDFKKMNMVQRQKLYAEDRELYNELTK